MKMELNVALLNPDGRVLREIRQPSKSFVRQFIQMLYIAHADLNFPMTDITNVARTIKSWHRWALLQLMAQGGGTEVIATYSEASPYYDLCSRELTGDYIGIQVGSGSTAPTPNNVAMETRIGHGQGAGQLVFTACEVEPPVISAPNATMLLRRYFTNKSGGDVTVREVGLYAVGFTSPYSGYLFLICRDVLGAPITVANTELLRVEYTKQITV